MSNSNQKRISELLAAGCNQDQAVLFAPTSLTTQEVLEFVTNDLGLDHIHLVRTFNVSPLDLRKWLDLLFLQTYVGQVLKLGISLEDASRIFQGKVDPERSTIITLLEQGTTIDEILLLKELGIYFFRTIATPQRPLREVFLDEIFGSKKLRELWELSGATTREAAYAHKSGLSPLQFVEKISANSPRPAAYWILEKKEYDFPGHPLPSAFIEQLGREKNEAFLEAVGYDVKVKSLKKDFVARANPTVVLFTNSRKGKNVVVAFSRNADTWTSRFLIDGSEANDFSEVGTLVEIGTHALEVVERHGLRVRDVKVLPSLKSLDSELLLAFGSWFGNYSRENLPTLASKEATNYTTIEGEIVFAPHIDVERHPGLRRIDRLGDVIFYSLGAALNPLVAISEVTDLEVPELFANAIAQLPSEVFDEIIVERTFLLPNEEFEYEGEEIRTNVASGSKEKIVIGCNWLLKIWIDEEKISVVDVLDRIEIVDDDEYEFGDEKWELISDLVDSTDLPSWYRLDAFFLQRPPIYINGRGYGVARDQRDLILEIDKDQEIGLPRIERPVASYAISELNSMVSGTDWHYLGFVRDDLMVGIKLLDEGETEVRLWEVDNNDWSKCFAEWLLHDIYGFNIKARYWIESTIGELPDVEELSADWFDEKLSSTLMVSFVCSPHTKEFDETVLAHLTKDKEIAEYVSAITQSESTAGQNRLRRQSDFRIQN